MCTSPILIDNPHRFHRSGLSYTFDNKSQKIYVPCGSCPSCVAMRQGFILQRIQMESLRSHLFMLTLTYNDESLVFTDCGDYSYPIPYYKDVQDMLKRIRKGFKIRYLFCSEYGKKRFRPHYHAIIAIEKDGTDIRLLERVFSRLFMSEWRRNYSDDTFHPVWRPLFTPVYKNGRCTTFDFHYIEPVRGHDNDVSYYVTKYVTKFDKRTVNLIKKICLDSSLDPDERRDLARYTRPIRCISKDFGDYKYPAIASKLREYASRVTDYKYPQYFDIYTGKQMPMAPYYAKRFLSSSHMYHLFEKYSTYVDDSSLVYDTTLSPIDAKIKYESDINKIADFEKKMKKLYERCDF